MMEEFHSTGGMPGGLGIMEYFRAGETLRLIGSQTNQDFMLFLFS